MLKNVKNTTLPGLFDLLAPHSCRGCGHIGTPLCDRCKKYIISQHHNLCPICHQSNLDGKCQNCQNLPPIFIIGHKSDLIGDLIQDLKYNSVRALAHPLAEILNIILPNTSKFSNQTVIVPLPTISRHIRERGLDHTLLIAKQLAKLRHHTTVQNLLTRQKSTVQVGSDRQTRLQQAVSAYNLNSNTKINPNFTYILLDDVWTTGASLQSAFSLLKKSGARNIILAVLALSSPKES